VKRSGSGAVATNEEKNARPDSLAVWSAFKNLDEEGQHMIAVE
jgi:hypothetical protein